jgi:lysophospholipase L1-like esterase
MIVPGVRRHGRSRRYGVAAALSLLVAVLVPAGPVSAHPYRAAQDLVVLGDSFASGVGNPPYIDGSANCKRSEAAYGPLLARYGIVRLQSFAACSGARTTDVLGTGGNPTQPVQIDSVTAETDVVAVQVLGNDFRIAQIEPVCVVDDCSRLPLLQEMIDAVPVEAPGLLDALYDAIEQRAPRATVIVVGYPYLFDPDGGPRCDYMNADELAAVTELTDLLNEALRTAAAAHDFRFAAADRAFAGHDVCARTPLIYTPLPPSGPFPSSADPSGQGGLHPNRYGQGLYALLVAHRLFA